MSEILQRIKTILNITNQDSLIEEIYSIATQKILNIIGEASLPAELEWIATELTIERFNRIGSEGIQSESVDGKSTTYITYMYYDSNNSYSGDNELLGWVDYYDFDIYSKGNYLNIIESVKSVMKQNGFMFQPSRSSADMYEDDTGYYHRTLSFAIERQENEVITPSL